jgi:uncharacterized protein YjbI with pentapeptide repeats
MPNSNESFFERIFTNEEKAALKGEVFLCSELVGVDLSGADLRKTSFERATLSGCNLSGADLRGAWFISSELRCVNLRDAIFGDGNRFDGTLFIDVVGIAPEAREHIERTGGTFQPAHASLR